MIEFESVEPSLEHSFHGNNKIVWWQKESYGLICPLMDYRSYAGMLDLTEGRRDKNALHQQMQWFF